jgi:hypothetical protein
MTLSVRLVPVVALASAVVASPAGGQVRASELATMAQTIDGTHITIVYSRPRARGRDPIFGTRVANWDEVWTPGANWATTFEVDKDVRLDGHPVPKGKYSVWFVIRKSGDWSFVLDPRPKRYHMDPPDSTARQIRFLVHPREGAFTDVLTWSMPELRMEGGTLEMRWARTVISANLEVDASLQTTLAEREARAYVGRYDYAELDSTGKVTKSSVFVIDYENGTLKGAWVPQDGYFKHFALVRIAPDWFAPGVYDDEGVIYEVLRPDMTFEFTRVNGIPVSFVMRDEDDTISAKGTRRP